MFFLNSIIKGLIKVLLLLLPKISNNIFEFYPQLLLEQITRIDLLFLLNKIIFDNPFL